MRKQAQKQHLNIGLSPQVDKIAKTFQNSFELFKNAQETGPSMEDTERDNAEKLEEDKRKSAVKISNLRFLGILKAASKEQKYNAQTSKDDSFVFQRMQHPSKKGFNADIHQYYLNLNPSLRESNRNRKWSHSERITQNLYDDDKLGIESSLQTQGSGVIQLIQSNESSQQQSKKKQYVRRRSCYCDATGIQCLKSQRIDLVFPITIIKNIIFMRVKKRQAFLAKKISAVDKLASVGTRSKIDTDNRGVVLQSKNSSSNFELPAHSNKSGAKILRQPFSQNKQTSSSTKSMVSLHLDSEHDCDQVQSSKKINKISQQKCEEKEEADQNPSSQTSIKLILNEERRQAKQPAVQPFQLFRPSLNADKKGSSIRDENNQNNGMEQSQRISKNLYHPISLNINSTSSNNVNDSGNGTKHETTGKTPRNSFRKEETQNQNQLDKSIVKRRSSQQTSQRNSLEIPKHHGMQSSGESTQHSQNMHISLLEKRKKLIAKLRAASKLVGIQEKQRRRKSLKYHQEYYDAVQELDDNNSQLDEEFFDSNDTEKQGEKKVKKKAKAYLKQYDFETQKHNAQVVTQQIIDSLHLRFNYTLNSFVDERSISTHAMAPSANLTVFSKDNINQEHSNQRLKNTSYSSLLSPTLKENKQALSGSESARDHYTEIKQSAGCRNTSNNQNNLMEIRSLRQIHLKKTPIQADKEQRIQPGIINSQSPSNHYYLKNGNSMLEAQTKYDSYFTFTRHQPLQNSFSIAQQNKAQKSLNDCQHSSIKSESSSSLLRSQHSIHLSPVKQAAMNDSVKSPRHLNTPCNKAFNTIGRIASSTPHIYKDSLGNNSLSSFGSLKQLKKI